MLTRLSNRLVAGCQSSPLVVLTRRIQQAKPLVVCAWSKRDEVVSNWEELRANPEQWYDNRNRKTNPKAPDFVRKDDRNVAIWIDGRDNPAWSDQVLAELDERGPQEPQQQQQQGGRRERGGSDQDVEAKWLSLRDNPQEWYDNRSRKTNPRAPDFVRKDDRSTALWIDGRGNPDWFQDVLAEVDARAAERTSRRNSEYGSENSGRGGSDRQAEDLAKWEDLRNNPGEWYDNRARKQNPRAPDFVRRDDRNTAIWLDSRSTPEWADEVLQMLEQRREQRQSAYRDERGQQEGQHQEAEYRGQDREAKREAELANWEALRANPEEWFDNRNSKLNPRMPDFKRKDDRSVALWLSSYSKPEWVEEFLVGLDAGRYAGYGRADAPRAPRRSLTPEELEGRKAADLPKWEMLRANPDAWFDNRARKTNPKAPDFKLKEDRNVAIWVESYGTPDWAPEFLQQLDAARAGAQQDMYSVPTPAGY